MTEDVSRPTGTVDAAAAGEPVEPLLQASRVMTAAVVRSLATVNPALSVPQLRALVLVAVEGSMNLGAVAEALGVNPSSASRTCDRLVTAGLLHRTEADHDRRQVALTVSLAGSRMIEAVMGARRRELATVVEAMPAADRRALMTALAAFNQAAVRAGHPEAGPDLDHHLVAWLG